MPTDIWDYVASAYAVDDDNNRIVYIDAIMHLRCPGCVLGASSGNSAVHCVLGSIQQTMCVPYIQYDDAPALFTAKNTAAWQTVDTSALFPTYYVEGDREAHDPLIGPGAGDPDYLGPYE